MGHLVKGSGLGTPPNGRMQECALQGEREASKGREGGFVNGWAS